MTQIQTKFWLLLLGCSVVVGAKYKCYSYGSHCEIYKLDLTRNSYEIELVGNQKKLNACTELRLYGKVPVLSVTQICRVMPNLRQLHASRVLMEEIDENAFVGCENLEVLNLNDNKFENITQSAFKGLSNLKILNIGGGNVPIFNKNLMELKGLENLKLNQLDITVFPADILRHQKNLIELNLNSNNLFDLDVESILEHTPTLETIYLDDNNFKCSRLLEILMILRDNSVKTGVCAGNFKKRNYDVDKIEEIHCLSDSIWESEIKKSPFESQMFRKKDEKFDKKIVEQKITKELQKIQEEQNVKMSSLEEKYKEGMKMMFNKSEELLFDQDAKIMDLEDKLEKILFSIAPNSENNASHTDLTALEEKLETMHKNYENQSSTISSNILNTMNTFKSSLGGLSDEQLSELKNLWNSELKKLNNKKYGCEQKTLLDSCQSTFGQFATSFKTQIVNEESAFKTTLSSFRSKIISTIKEAQNAEENNFRSLESKLLSFSIKSCKRW